MGYKPLGSSHHDKKNNNLDFNKYTQHYCAIQQQILEAVVADRISYAVETYGLLPTNHFGARKRRSAEQALLLFQEQVYKAWRNRKVVSLVSFDVKGAYNGVFKDRLMQRLEARGIPKKLIK